MQQLLDAMLGLARVTQDEMRWERVDLSACAHAIAAELQDAERHRRVEFVIAPGAVVTGDARLLRVALVNLLANAWKYTSQHDRARIEFGVLTDGEPIYVVRDDGAGFDPSLARRLFRAFQRLHLPDEFEGTGIGLATVQRIIHRHGGRIWAEGGVEQGAAFFFTLPEPQ